MGGVSFVDGGGVSFGKVLRWWRRDGSDAGAGSAGCAGLVDSTESLLLLLVSERPDGSDAGAGCVGLVDITDLLLLLPVSERRDGSDAGAGCAGLVDITDLLRLGSERRCVGPPLVPALPG